MRVGIDGSRLHAGMSGIGRYVAGQLEPLDLVLPDAEFFIYTRARQDLRLPSARWVERFDDHPISRKFPSVLWTKWRLGSLARADHLDVFWAANTLFPRNLADLPVVTTVYDLNHLLVPESMTIINRHAHRRWFASDVQLAAAAVAISQGTADRMLGMMGQRADAIVRPAITIQSIRMSTAGVESALRELGVRSPYILAVGTREPRKNLASVVESMKRLKRDPAFNDHRLVLAGANGWGTDAVSRASPPWVQPLGYVSDHQLVALYTRAEAFVFPSLYEGFGIPVSEARAFGCPVVATDPPELREAGDDHVVYVQPTPQALTDGLRIALARPRPPARGTGQASSMAADALGQVLVSAAGRGKSA